MSKKIANLEKMKKWGYKSSVLIVFFNIIFWIYLLWFNESFLISGTYGKIVITSIALLLLFLVLAGFATFMLEEAKLKKDNLIN